MSKFFSTFQDGSSSCRSQTAFVLDSIKWSFYLFEFQTLKETKKVFFKFYPLP